MSIESQWIERLSSRVVVEPFPQRQLEFRLAPYPYVEEEWPTPPKQSGDAMWHLIWFAENHPELLPSAVKLHLYATWRVAIRAACDYRYTSLSRYVYNVN